MTTNAKRACHCCRKAKSLESFPPLQPGGLLHPYCRPCLTIRVRRNGRARDQAATAATKECALCAQRLPLDTFHWIKSSQTHHSYCRGCHSVYMAERYRRRRRQAVAKA
jgi:hypothetical protein